MQVSKSDYWFHFIASALGLAVALVVSLGMGITAAENRILRQKLQDIKYVVRFSPMDGSDWTIVNIISDGKGLDEQHGAGQMQNDG